MIGDVWIDESDNLTQIAVESYNDLFIVAVLGASHQYYDGWNLQPETDILINREDILAEGWTPAPKWIAEKFKVL